MRGAMHGSERGHADPLQGLRGSLGGNLGGIPPAPTGPGGTVAALVADAQDLPYLALWDPVVAGAQYMRDFLRSQLLHRMVQDAAQAGLGQTPDESRGSAQGSGVRDPRGQLETVGRAD